MIYYLTYYLMTANTFIASLHNFMIYSYIMKTKKSRSFYIILAAILSVLFILFAVKPLSTEYQFIPEWKIDVTNPNLKQADSNQKIHHYKLGQTLGYFTEDGKITNFVSFPFKASVSEYYYTTYNTNNKSSQIFNPDGTEKSRINISGFPMIDNENIFVFLPGGSAFVMCDSDGNRMWEFSGAVPITAFDSSKSGVACGFADGTVRVLDLTGRVIQNFIPGGSDYPVILGVAISNAGDMIATVSGQNKQRFVLAKKNGTQTKIIFHEFLDISDPSQKLVKFSDNDNYVYYVSGDKLGIVDTQTKKHIHINISGQAISLRENNNSVFLLTKDQNKYTVYTVEKFATLTGSFSFEANNTFIHAYDDALYVGKDYTISKLHIKKE